MVILRILYKLSPLIMASLLLVLGIQWLTVKFSDKEKEAQTKLEHQSILKSVEALGKMELVRYNFKEITELKEKNEKYLWIFDVPDSKVVLITNGEAVGCIDLAKIRYNDIEINQDAVLIRLPKPELCYYKLNLSESKLYTVEKVVYYRDEKEMIEKAYKSAEAQIMEAALNSGILEQTKANAELILKPLFERIAGKKVLFTYVMDTDISSPK